MIDPLLLLLTDSWGLEVLQLVSPEKARCCSTLTARARLFERFAHGWTWADHSCLLLSRDCVVH